MADEPSKDLSGHDGDRERQLSQRMTALAHQAEAMQAQMDVALCQVKLLTFALHAGVARRDAEIARLQARIRELGG